MLNVGGAPRFASRMMLSLSLCRSVAFVVGDPEHTSIACLLRGVFLQRRHVAEVRLSYPVSTVRLHT